MDSQIETELTRQACPPSCAVSGSPPSAGAALRHGAPTLVHGADATLPTPYYQDAFATIYHGDCQTILPSINGISLVLTDPPYGTQGLGGGYGRRQNHGGEGRKIANDADLSVVEECVKLLPACLQEIAVVAAFCAARRMNEVDVIFRNAAFEFLGELIWDKAMPGLGYTIRYSHESCLVYRRGELPTPTRAALSMVRASISHINTQARHPHEKPLLFWLNAMQLLDGEILDPFMGSGTTLRAAKDLGRKAVGIELEERYCEMAASLLQQECLNFTPAVAGPAGLQGLLVPDERVSTSLRTAEASQREENVLVSDGADKKQPL